MAQDVLEAKENEFNEVLVDPEDSNIKVLLSVDLDQDLTKFMKNRKSTFVWKNEDLIGISRDIITHKLNIDPCFKPINKKKEICT